MSAVFFILGASGGIGRALTQRLAQDGAKLVLAGRSAAPIADLAASVGATTVELDGSCFEAVDLAVERAQQQLGRLDGVVNCAGSLLLKPAHRTTQTEYREVLSANLDTAFALVRAGARAMMQTGGSIVLVSSVAARVGLANHEAIAAAKSGIQGLALAAAASYAPRGIRVNVVAPGLTRTPLTADLLRSQAAEAASVAMHPLGRLGEPGDVAAAIHWLLDARQSWITGQVLGVDGGLGSVRGR